MNRRAPLLAAPVARPEGAGVLVWRFVLPDGRAVARYTFENPNPGVYLLSRVEYCNS